ncbi:diguanylate cyclase [bacterium]|nr:MAG: diguanylate cyclase [bacterium]
MSTNTPLLSYNRVTATRALQPAHKDRQFLTETMPVALWISHADGRTEFCNDYWMRFTGLSPEQSQNGGWMSVVHPDDLDSYRASWANAVAHRAPFEAQVRFRRAVDGHYRRHLCRATPKFDRHHNVICWFGSCADVEDQLHLCLPPAPTSMTAELPSLAASEDCVADAIDQGEKRHRVALDNMPGMIYQFELTAEGTMRFLYVSSGSRALFGLEPDAIERDASLLFDLITPEIREAFQESILESASNMTRWVWEGWSTPTNSARKWISCSSMPTLKCAGSIVWDGLLMDATTQKLAQIQVEIQRLQLEEANLRLGELNQKLDALATCDGLTGLKNRRRFQEHIREEFQRHTRFDAPLSLMMIDVDKFKHFNDTYGHLAGDEILRRVGGLLRSSMREVDFVARYGGEEFVVVLPRTAKSAALMLGERVRCAVASQQWSEREITVSIGVATLERIEDHSPEHLLEAADQALYQSKHRGRNCVTYNPCFDPVGA